MSGSQSGGRMKLYTANLVHWAHKACACILMSSILTPPCVSELTVETVVACPSSFKMFGFQKFCTSQSWKTEDNKRETERQTEKNLPTNSPTLSLSVCLSVYLCGRACLCANVWPSRSLSVTDRDSKKKREKDRKKERKKEKVKTERNKRNWTRKGDKVKASAQLLIFKCGQCGEKPSGMCCSLWMCPQNSSKPALFLSALYLPVPSVTG